MNPKFDEIDAAILERRSLAYNAISGPRVGDFLETTEGLLRFTHDWDDAIQTTVRPSHPCHGDMSFYLGDGYVEFSGSLDPAIDKTKLRDTGEQREGTFWFFHHDYKTAHNGVPCKMQCRVYRMAA
jgi:hypothetical protein